MLEVWSQIPSRSEFSGSIT